MNYGVGHSLHQCKTHPAQHSNQYNMEKQCQLDLASKYSKNNHNGAKTETKKHRIKSSSEIELQMLGNGSDTTNCAEVSEKTLKTKPEIGTRPKRVNNEILEILKKRTPKTCYLRNQEELGSGTNGRESLEAEQGKQTTEFKQRVPISTSKNAREKDSKLTTWRMDLLALVKKKTNPGESCSSSTENTAESSILENQASDRGNRALVKNARSAMRVAKQQSKHALNNLYVEELLDDLILFNLLVEHKLTVKKLEKHKEALIKKNEEEEEEKKSEEAEREKNENKGFVVDYDVLYEDEYKVWIDRMQARFSVTQRYDGGRVPGSVGRPTLWKGYLF